MVAKIRLLAVIGLLALGSASQALANGYLLLSVGNSKDDLIDESATGFKVGVGTSFSENLAAELTIVDLGTINKFGAEFSQSGVAASLIPVYKISEEASVFAKVGLFAWTFEASIPGLGSGEETGSDIFYGFGFEYKVANTASVVAEYEKYEVWDGDVDMLSVGVKIGF